MFILQPQTALRKGLEDNLDAEISEPFTDDRDTEQVTDEAAAGPDDDIFVEPGENDSFCLDDEGNEDRLDSGYPADALGLDACEDVCQWKILAVGKRPQDFIARDCLFGSLFRDYRATWFHRYLQRPSEWMKELVEHLPFDDQRQALEYVALQYQHKMHLTRLTETAMQEFGDDSQEVMRLHRLWRCPPCTVLVGKEDKSAMPHPCGLFRLCPWCFARKVTELYDCLKNRLLKESAGKCLVLVKADPFNEPFFGRNDRHEREDLRAISNHCLVRDYYGRYYGLDRERAIATRDALIGGILADMKYLAPMMTDGLWTHQMGSGQDANWRRTFLHDVGLVGVIDKGDRDWLRSDPSCVAFESDNAFILRRSCEEGALLRILVIPADHPSALRTVLAGTGWSYSMARFGLNERASKEGISGALSWQPTLFLDDQVWFPYTETTRKLHLYHPFGSWTEGLAAGIAENRATVDEQFRHMQAERLNHARQQKGNRVRRRNADERRRELFEIAQSVWPKTLAEGCGGRGRPAYRSKMKDQLTLRGIEASRREMDWLMKTLQGADRMGI